MPFDVDAIIRHYGETKLSKVDSEEGAWDEKGAKITLDETAVAAARTALNAEHAANTHKFPRLQEYPEIGDQLDDLYHKGAFSDTMAAKLKAVKDKYPKP